MNFKDGVNMNSGQPMNGDNVGDLLILGNSTNFYWQINTIGGQDMFLLHLEDSKKAYTTEGYAYWDSNGNPKFDEELFLIINEEGVEYVDMLYQPNMDYEALEWWFIGVFDNIINFIVGADR